MTVLPNIYLADPTNSHYVTSDRELANQKISEGWREITGYEFEDDSAWDLDTDSEF